MAETGGVTPIVVKVGGSYAHSPHLPDLIGALDKGGGYVVVVPGGGPFADCVRGEQQTMRFDDAAAHRMALLAMAQFGYALCARSESLAPAPNLDAITRVLAKGRVPVWLPLDLLDGNPDVAETWDMTSDSLAAWLARRLDAKHLVFVKSLAPQAATLPALVSAGILDPLMPRFLAGARFGAWLCGPSDIPGLAEGLDRREGAGMRVPLA